MLGPGVLKLLSVVENCPCQCHERRKDGVCGYRHSEVTRPAIISITVKTTSTFDKMPKTGCLDGWMTEITYNLTSYLTSFATPRKCKETGKRIGSQLTVSTKTKQRTVCGISETSAAG
ncbi:hypothetical protein GE061_012140 [Apolygus lucorum]|uniref:Uncharacterized protein n=1 Tax=Apolygus lucorum TaxID=248454 RepID=A0A6A4JXJ9_APOLU|nr:hypothetical protein GE061_012140 [Apolygus lucorum]